MAKNITITIIPDMHGDVHWKKAMTITSTYYVSLGDWFDSFTVPHDKQIENFKEYVTWVRQDPEHRLTCIGNHDLAYLQSLEKGMNVSGHSAEYHEQIHAILMENIMMFKPIIELYGIVFSHAGVSKRWMANCDININRLCSNYNWVTNPEPLDFQTRNISKKYNYHVLDPAGDNIFQSPLWIRPKSLLKNSYFPFQVVGHSEICHDFPIYVINNHKKVIFCDSPEHNIIFTINIDEIHNHPCILFKDFVHIYYDNDLDE